MATTRKIRRVSKPHDAEGGATVVSEDEGGLEAEDTTELTPDITRKLDELQRRVKQISDDSARAIGKAVQVSDELETLKNETLENMQVAFDENAEILEAIEKDVTDLKNRVPDDPSVLIEKARADLDKRIAGLEGTRDAISADVKMLKSEGEAIRRSLTSALEQKMPEIDQKIAGGLGQAEAQITALRADLKGLIEKAGGRAEQAEKSLADVQGRVTRAEKRVEDAELKLLELDEEREKGGDLQKQVVDLAARLDAVAERVSTELEKAQGAYKEVQTTLQAANGALERTEKANREIETLQTRLSQAEGQVGDLVTRVQDSSAQVESNRERIGLAFKLMEDVEDKIRRLVAPVDDALGLIEEFETVRHDGELGFELNDLLQVMIKHSASDLHLKVGAPPTVRLDGELIPVGNQVLTEADCKRLVFNAISKSQRRRLLDRKEIDFAYAIPSARFRVNAFLQRGTVSAAFRMLRQEIPTIEDLGLPQVLKQLASYNNGLILVTGPAGAGKSTTLASMIDYINTNKKQHVITVEDPVEFVHKDKLSIITQREVGQDTTSFPEALKQALRQDPNVILIGEMRDPETMMTAVMAAETGHLVLSTLHTPNTVQAIDRIIDVFAGEQQRQFRLLLANTLRGVVSQRLLSRSDEQGRVPAVEVMIVTPTIASLILEGKTNDIYPYMQQGATEGMQTFTQSLTQLYEAGLITKEEALFHADQPTEFRLGVEGHSTGTASYAEGDTLMNWL